MRLVEFCIEDFRSIESVAIRFPLDTPVVLFGPNNSGKSNVVRAMDVMLGERWPPTIQFEDSDSRERDPHRFPNIVLSAMFNGEYYPGTFRNAAADHIVFRTNFESERKTENCFTYPDGNKMYLSQESRQKCQLIMVDATRDIERQLSYFSKYSMLSRMAHRMHDALVERQRDALAALFQQLKAAFEAVPEYQAFLRNLRTAFSRQIEGFEHRLDVDLSAYDPNNYFHSLRIVAADSEGTRAFGEFGTGEQQILLIAFMSAYAKTFTSEAFILAIEEPEAHLHPLAQAWLARNIEDICRQGVQVVVTTHSPAFLRLGNLEGFVRVYKDSNVTRTKQLTSADFAEHCVGQGASSSNTKAETVLPFYEANTFRDQVSGFFARAVLLVEGETEYFALPNYFARAGYDLVRAGVQIVNCHGKSQLCRNYRLFTAYGYECVILFDRDESHSPNAEILATLAMDGAIELSSDPTAFRVLREKAAAYFGVDFEAYMQAVVPNYAGLDAGIGGSKPFRAKSLSERSLPEPPFVAELAAQLTIDKHTSGAT